MLRHQPRLADLQSLIARVPNYPIADDELVELAIEERADPAVIEFYEAFPADEIFESEEDLLARSEQVAILSREERNQPFEYMYAPEED